MKKFFIGLALCLATTAQAAVEKSGYVKSVRIWGAIAKATVCASETSCTAFWISLDESRSQAVLSMWLTAKMAENRVYIQGFDPDKSEHPYSNASRFYGMNLN